MDQLQNQRQGQATSGRAYQNVALTVIAGCLCLLVLDRQGVSPDLGPAAASAQPGRQEQESTGILSGLEQRKQMIMQLESIGGKLDRLEAKLSAGIKISNLPAGLGEGGRIGGGGGGGGGEPKPGSKLEVKPDNQRAEANKPASVKPDDKR
jgi:hypothetical protein